MQCLFCQSPTGKGQLLAFLLTTGCQEVCRVQIDSLGHYRPCACSSPHWRAVFGGMLCLPADQAVDTAPVPTGPGRLRES